MAKEYRQLPAVERLWELFSLNPLTGDLYWRIRVSARCRLDKPAGCLNPNGYRVLRIDGVLYSVHRIIRAWVDGNSSFQENVDHWDRNPKNNQPWNLRLCNQSENMANVPHRGWTRVKNDRYAASIKFQGKRIHLGEFYTPLEAYTAYTTAKKLLFGHFACLSPHPSLE